MLAMRMRAIYLVVACLWLAVAGCFAPSFRDETYSCSAGSLCPAGMVCLGDGLCHNPGDVAGDVVTAADRPVGRDAAGDPSPAPVPDLPQARDLVSVADQAE